MAKYSETLTEHVMAPRNGGVIEDADLTNLAGSPGRCASLGSDLLCAEERCWFFRGCNSHPATGSLQPVRRGGSERRWR